MTLYILANPNAGSHIAEHIIFKIKESYPQLAVNIFMTVGPEDEKSQIEAILKEFVSSEDQLMILGGDGTLSKALRFWPASLPFAYYPTGSGNDFAKAMNITSLYRSVDAILEGKTSRIYVLNSSYGTVVNSMDFGFAAQVINGSTNSILKKILNKVKLGKLTYLFFGIKTLFSKQAINLELTLDEKSYQLDNLFFISVANSLYFGGGIMIWPTASAKKKEVDIVYFKNGNFYQRLQSLLALLTKRHESSHTIQHLTGVDVVLKSKEKLLLQIDGETCTANEVTLTYQERSMYI
ncbi:diacylglycerol/lipid kinase family protein [Streptococcus suis]|uniref:diacylglycerol/lipid kinase family protein n=1 Tax=Streptococcus suis TaxID=1307 RepID=UPI00041A7946|nr:diacylglycerol kinase family protein [Streptococcus suis]